MMVTTSAPSPRPLAEADRIRVEFGKLVAVGDVSLHLHAGDLLGLIGPNGAGKTTLMRAMVGLQAPTSGTARIMGLDVDHRSAEVRRQVGFAPDSPPVYEDLTVDQFLTFIACAYGLGAGEARERIDFWLEQLWLIEKRADKIKTLSRGMRQRVTVARTLVPNPNVILLDEPSAGLDPAGRIQFRQVLASLRDQGKALVVSSHILADLEEYCTHVAILEHGRLLRFSPVHELHGHAAGRCHYRVTLAGEYASWPAVLQGVEGVEHVERRDGAWAFEYHHAPEQAAGLLRTLVQRDVPIASFGVLDDSLEHAYLRAGVKQVD